MPRNGNEPAALAVLKSVYAGNTGVAGGPLQLLTALILKCDAEWHDPRTPLTFTMTLSEMSEMSLLSVSSIDRHRKILRAKGFLSYEDAEGRRRPTTYVFCMALTCQNGEESTKPAETLVSHSDETVSHSDETNPQSDETTKENARVPSLPSPRETEGSDTRGREISAFDGKVQDYLFAEHGVKPNYFHPEFRDAIARAVEIGMTVDEVTAGCDQAVVSYRRNGSVAQSVGGYVRTIKQLVTERKTNPPKTLAGRRDKAAEDAALRKLGMNV
jgi:hypothetical protein